MQVPFLFVLSLVVVVGCCGHIKSSTQEMGNGHCTPLSSESHLGKPSVLRRVRTPSSPFDMKLNMKREKLSTRNELGPFGLTKPKLSLAKSQRHSQFSFKKWGFYRRLCLVTVE